MNAQAACQLTLNDAEREFLVEFLESALKDTRIEEHRTRAPNYREIILRKEQVIDSILQKLR